MDAPAKRKWPIVVGAVLGALILVVVIGLFVLDSLLTSKAHDEAAKLSQQLGRPVTIGSVSTKVLTGLGVAVSDVGIGPAAGEGVPRAQRQLAIQHLDVTLEDLRAGKPLDVVVTAAVLAEQKNFELRLHAAPLPPTLVPTPEKVTLKVQPIDLSPLAPFVPKDVGLQAGRFDANFEAQLRAAVSGRY